MLLLLYEDQELHVKRTSNTKIWIMLMQALILNKRRHLKNWIIRNSIVQSAQLAYLCFRKKMACDSNRHHMYSFIYPCHLGSDEIKTLCGLESTTYTPGSGLPVLILPLDTRSLNLPIFRNQIFTILHKMVSDQCDVPNYDLKIYHICLFYNSVLYQ